MPMTKNSASLCDANRRARRGAILLMLAVAGAAAADWPEPGEPVPAALPPTGTDAWAVEEAPVSPLADFRRQLKNLKQERDALKEDRKQVYRWLEEDQETGASDIMKLQYRLGGLLMQMAPAKTRVHSARPALGPAPEPKESAATMPPSWEAPQPDEQAPPLEEVSLRFAQAPDPLTLGQALFRAGNHQDALHAFRLVALDGLTTADRMPVKFLMATCLRRGGKREEAARLYREVANFAGDEPLASCAQWQLASMRWRKETDDRLARLRQRRLALEKNP